MPVELQIPAVTSSTQRSAMAVSGYAAKVRAFSNNPIAIPIASALDEIQSSNDAIQQALRAARNGVFTQIFVKDATGKIIGWIGSVDGYQGGWFQQLYVGGNGPASAPFFCDVDGNVFIGQNGSISILDPGGNTVGWLGEQAEATKVILTATNATPIVVGVNAHGYSNGDTVFLSGALGNTAANGYRIVKNKTANTFEITNLAGANVAGNGAYTGSGLSSRYFGGGWFQTLAVGGSGVTTAKLRAFANGDLNITNALITLQGSAATITLDPVLGQITIVDSPSAFFTTTLAANQISIYGSNDFITINAGVVAIAQSGLASDGHVVSIDGYSTSGYGPSIKFRQGRGSQSSPAQTQSGDPLSQLVGSGTKNTGAVGNDTARFYFAANENFTATNQGTDMVFEATAAGSNAKAEVGRIHNGVLDMLAYSAGGTPGITGSETFGVSLNLTTDTALQSIALGSSSAITSVDFGGSTTTSGSFVTGISGATSITVVTNVTLTSKTLTWKTGLITAIV